MRGANTDADRVEVAAIVDEIARVGDVVSFFT